MKLQVENISKSYGKHVNALSDISFELTQGKVMFVLGNSGGGKSTLLRLIAGYEFPDAGGIKKDGVLISNHNYLLPPQKRKIGMIFQDYALFPHLTVDQNIRFGYDKNSAQHELKELYELTQLSGFEGRYPHELSGGEQQRVALARSLAAQPDIILMDEPFSSIDVVNRELVRKELKDLIQRLGITTIIVSHDYRDALTIGDDVLVLDQGKMVQFGPVQDVNNQPSSEFVAKLFGH
jgi:iron(III) transport system ATP-binding protein